MPFSEAQRAIALIKRKRKEQWRRQRDNERQQRWAANAEIRETETTASSSSIQEPQEVPPPSSQARRSGALDYPPKKGDPNEEYASLPSSHSSSSVLQRKENNQQRPALLPVDVTRKPKKSVYTNDADCEDDIKVEDMVALAQRLEQRKRKRMFSQEEFPSDSEEECKEEVCAEGTTTTTEISTKISTTKPLQTEAETGEETVANPANKDHNRVLIFNLKHVRDKNNDDNNRNNANDDDSSIAVLEEQVEALEEQVEKQSQMAISMSHIADSIKHCETSDSEKPRFSKKQNITNSNENDDEEYMEVVRKQQEKVNASKEALQVKKANTQAERGMRTHSTGKAVMLMKKVYALHDRMKFEIGDPLSDNMSQENKEVANLHSQISPVAVDDLVELAEKMLQQQEAFGTAGKPCHVDIGYHYTQQDNMKNIRTTGLLTHKERNASGVQSNYNGSVYGDGVYTGNNPFAFSSYGNVGLLLARLKGTVGKEEIDWRQITSSACGQDKDNPVDIDEDEPAPSVDPDTVVGNKQLPCGADKASASTGSGGQSASPYFDEVVLKQSSQCVALIRFSASIVNPHLSSCDDAGNGLIYKYHCSLQEIIDKLFNRDQPEATVVPELIPWGVKKEERHRLIGSLTNSARIKNSPWGSLRLRQLKLAAETAELASSSTLCSKKKNLPQSSMTSSCSSGQNSLQDSSSVTRLLPDSSLHSQQTQKIGGDVDKSTRKESLDVDKELWQEAGTNNGVEVDRPLQEFPIHSQ